MVGADPQIHSGKDAGKRLLNAVLPLLNDDELFILATQAADLAEGRIAAILEVAAPRGFLA